MHTFALYVCDRKVSNEHAKIWQKFAFFIDFATAQVKEALTREETEYGRTELLTPRIGGVLSQRSRQILKRSGIQLRVLIQLR